MNTFFHCNLRMVCLETNQCETISKRITQPLITVSTIIIEEQNETFLGISIHCEFIEFTKIVIYQAYQGWSLLHTLKSQLEAIGGRDLDPTSEAVRGRDLKFDSEPI